MATESYTCLVSVVGFSAHGATYSTSTAGVGKSCLCSRFRYCGVDDYVADHPSLLALHEFESQVVSTEPFLYWGPQKVTYPGPKGKDVVVTHEVVEHTLFYHDETSQPFSPLKKLLNHVEYAKRALVSPDSSRKISYYARDAIGFPDKYTCLPYPSNVNRLSRGFIIVVDISLDGMEFERQLTAVETIAYEMRKQTVVVAATKRDCYKESSLRRLTEWATKQKLPLIETSAKDNVNVQDAFRLVASRVLKKAKIPDTYMDFASATGYQLTLRSRAKKEFKGYLSKRIRSSTISFEVIEKIPEYQKVLEMTGKFATDEILAQHLLEVRNTEISTYPGVEDNPDMRIEMLEEFIDGLIDFVAHQSTLYTMMSSYVTDGAVYYNETFPTSVSTTFHPDTTSTELEVKETPLLKESEQPTSPMRNYVKLERTENDVSSLSCIGQEEIQEFEGGMNKNTEEEMKQNITVPTNQPLKPASDIEEIYDHQEPVMPHVASSIPASEDVDQLTAMSIKERAKLLKRQISGEKVSIEEFIKDELPKTQTTEGKGEVPTSKLASNISHIHTPPLSVRCSTKIPPPLISPKQKKRDYSDTKLQEHKQNKSIEISSPVIHSPGIPPPTTPATGSLPKEPPVLKPKPTISKKPVKYSVPLTNANPMMPGTPPMKEKLLSSQSTPLVKVSTPGTPPLKPSPPGTPPLKPSSPRTPSSTPEMPLKSPSILEMKPDQFSVKQPSQSSPNQKFIRKSYEQAPLPPQPKQESSVIASEAEPRKVRSNYEPKLPKLREKVMQQQKQVKNADTATTYTSSSAPPHPPMHPALSPPLPPLHYSPSPSPSHPTSFPPLPPMHQAPSVSLPPSYPAPLAPQSLSYEQDLALRCSLPPSQPPSQSPSLHSIAEEHIRVNDNKDNSPPPPLPPRTEEMLEITQNQVDSQVIGPLPVSPPKTTSPKKEKASQRKDNYFLSLFKRKDKTEEENILDKTTHQSGPRRSTMVNMRIRPLPAEPRIHTDHDEDDYDQPDRFLFRPPMPPPTASQVSPLFLTSSHITSGHSVFPQSAPINQNFFDSTQGSQGSFYPSHQLLLPQQRHLLPPPVPARLPNNQKGFALPRRSQSFNVSSNDGYVDVDDDGYEKTDVIDQIRKTVGPLAPSLHPNDSSRSIDYDYPEIRGFRSLPREAARRSQPLPPRSLMSLNTHNEPSIHQPLVKEDSYVNMDPETVESDYYNSDTIRSLVDHDTLHNKPKLPRKSGSVDDISIYYNINAREFSPSEDSPEERKPVVPPKRRSHPIIPSTNPPPEKLSHKELEIDTGIDAETGQMRKPLPPRNIPRRGFLLDQTPSIG